MSLALATRWALAPLDQLGLRMTAVVLDPGLEHGLHSDVLDPDSGQRERRTEAAFVQCPGIVHAVDVQDRHGSAGPDRVDQHGTAHRRDRGDPVGRLRRQTIGEHATVRHPRGVDPRRVDAHPGRQVIEHRPNEADIVDVLRPRVAAAIFGVPGEQSPAPAARAVRRDDDEPFHVRQPIQPHVSRVPLGVAPAAVKAHHHRQRPGGIGRYVNDVGSRPTGVGERDRVVAGRQPVRAAAG